MLKKMFAVVCFVGMVAVAEAAVLGVLVHSAPATSVGGHIGWACTYNVNGQEVTVFSQSICPPTMYFN